MRAHDELAATPGLIMASVTAVRTGTGIRIYPNNDISADRRRSQRQAKL